MELIDFYEQLQNPLDDEHVLNKLIECYSKKSEWLGSYYGKLVKTVEKSGKKGAYRYADSDKFYSLMFNKWKNSIASYNVSDPSKMNPDFLRLREFLKNIPDVTTKEEADKILTGEAVPEDLKETVDGFRWTNFGEGSSWTHVCSRNLTAYQDQYQEVEHRLYLDMDSIDTYKMIYLFAKKCDEHHVPYYFKFDQYGDRDDTIVIYSSTENLLKYVEILQEIKKENPELVARSYRPPLLTGVYDGWIGYGSENDNHRISFNERRANVIEDVIDKKANEWVENNKLKIFELDGKKVVLKEYLTQRIIDNFYEELEKRTKQGNRTLEKQKEILGYTSADLADPNFRKRTTNTLLTQINDWFDGKGKVEGISFIKGWTEHVNVNEVITRFVNEIPKLDPTFTKKVKQGIIEESKKVGIDPDKYCFDLIRSNPIKALAKNRTIQPSPSTKIHLTENDFVVEDLVDEPIQKPEPAQKVIPSKVTGPETEQEKVLRECLDILRTITPTKEVVDAINAFEDCLQNGLESYQTAPEIPDSVREELDKARSTGEESAKKEVHGEEKEQSQTENPKYNLSDNFIINKETGEVLSQRNLSIYDKAKNIARATGETVSLEEEILVQMKDASIANYAKNLPTTPTKAMQQVYGDKWQEALISAFEAGWNSGMQQELERAKQEGISSRTKEEQPRMIDFEELKFISENFELKTNNNGETEVINKNTNQVVTSPRTISSALFADEWIKAAGSVEKNGEIEIDQNQAFSNESMQVYQLLQAQTRSDISTKGSIDIDELKMNTDLMGPHFSKTAQVLIRNKESLAILDSHFRVQTPNAKQPVVEQVSENIVTGPHK